MSKLKYLSLFSLPLLTYISFTSYGWFSYLPLISYFVILPLFELFLPPSVSNLTYEQKLKMEKDPFYEGVLYASVIIQYLMLYFFLKQIQEPGLANSDMIGRTISMGILCGVMGINVGHELGHRKERLARFLGELLMLSSMENHFTPYHNRGHHLNVGTPRDPATARRNEPLIFFWFRSQFGSYFQAWRIEKDRLMKKKIHWFNLKNRMVTYTIAQLILLTVIYLSAGLAPLLLYIGAAAFGIMLLETINYIEHYGLTRERNERGRFERVQHRHSWNSNHIFGRMILLELSRHSDHHYQASKKYQLLDSHEESPQMPTGYPGMMIFALFSPLWFKYMNKRIDSFQKQVENTPFI